MKIKRYILSTLSIMIVLSLVLLLLRGPEFFLSLDDELLKWLIAGLIVACGISALPKRH